MNRDELIAMIPALPEGWEFAEPRPRRPKRGDWYWRGRPIEALNDHEESRVQCPAWILKRIEPDHNKLRREKLRDCLATWGVTLYFDDRIDHIEAIFAAHPLKGKE